jgi:hypothetical protein
MIVVQRGDNTVRQDSGGVYIYLLIPQALPDTTEFGTIAQR